MATCPEVYNQYSTKRLLVLERFTGAPLVDYDAIRSITSKVSMQTPCMAPACCLNSLRAVVMIHMFHSTLSGS